MFFSCCSDQYFTAHNSNEDIDILMGFRMLKSEKAGRKAVDAASQKLTAAQNNKTAAEQQVNVGL